MAQQIDRVTRNYFIWFYNTLREVNRLRYEINLNNCRLFTDKLELMHHQWKDPFEELKQYSFPEIRKINGYMLSLSQDNLRLYELDENITLIKLYADIVLEKINNSLKTNER